MNLRYGIILSKLHFLSLKYHDFTIFVSMFRLQDFHPIRYQNCAIFVPKYHNCYNQFIRHCVNFNTKNLRGSQVTRLNVKSVMCAT